jgi:hypothetical protein
MAGENEKDLERLDLSALDASFDDAAVERFVQRVRVAATPELMRRQSVPGFEWALLGLRRQVLTASAFIVLASVLALLMARAPAQVTTATTAKADPVATALGVPGVYARWVYAAGQPSSAELPQSGSNP